MQRLLWREPFQHRDAAHSNSPFIADTAHSQSTAHPLLQIRHIRNPKPTLLQIWHIHPLQRDLRSLHLLFPLHWQRAGDTFIVLN